MKERIIRFNWGTKRETGRKMAFARHIHVYLRIGSTPPLECISRKQCFRDTSAFQRTTVGGDGGWVSRWHALQAWPPVSDLLVSPTFISYGYFCGASPLWSLGRRWSVSPTESARMIAYVFGGQVRPRGFENGVRVYTITLGFLG